jgi:hypothetical protein
MLQDHFITDWFFGQHELTAATASERRRQYL